MYEILVVDDERAVRESLADTLRTAGFAVSVAKDGLQGVKEFAARRSDLVVLDLMMPGMDGYETCEAIREIDRDVPVILFTAYSTPANEVRGLETGADDFVAKDAPPEVLVARIRKSLERAHRYDNVDAPSSLTNTEAAIFRVLAAEPGRFHTVRTLYSEIRGEGYVGTEGNIRVHMSHLRGKLPAGYELLNVRGRGYALKSN